MKRMTWVMCVCAAVWLLGGGVSQVSAAAGGKKAKGKAAEKKKPGKAKAKAKAKARAAAIDKEPSFALMDRRLDLRPNQRTKLKKLWAERDKALSNWDLSQPGQQLVELRGELALAAPAQRSGLESRIAPLLAQRGLLERERLTRILAVLSKDQRDKWHALLLRREVDKVLLSKNISLTSPQEQKVRARCERAAKALPAVPTAADMARARDQISRAMLGEILTAAQRKKVDPHARAAGSKGKGKKGDGKGKKKSKGRNGGKGRSNPRARGGGKNNKRGKGKGGSMRGVMSAAARQSMADRKKAERNKADKTNTPKTPGGKAGYVQYVKPKSTGAKSKGRKAKPANTGKKKPRAKPKSRKK